jgi:hypothetical protein
LFCAETGEEFGNGIEVRVKVVSIVVHSKSEDNGEATDFFASISNIDGNLSLDIPMESGA